MSYEDSGFDAFLSRSIDDLPQSNLDSTGPVSTQYAYDRGQASGGMGDSYKMGGIHMSAKDNSITLNDGRFIVNDSSTSNAVEGGSGAFSYRDSQGNIVVQEGLLPDSTTGIKIIDSKGLTIAQFGRQLDGSTNLKFFNSVGLGIAQFGGYKDDTIALKIAKSGFDVATATNSQLVFNSAQNIFKIILSSSFTFAATNVTAGSPVLQQQVIPHGSNVVPAALFYIKKYVATTPQTIETGFPTTYYQLFTDMDNASSHSNTGDPNSNVGSQIGYAIDATNLYINRVIFSLSGTQAASAIDVLYYIFQESAA